MFQKIIISLLMTVGFILNATEIKIISAKYGTDSKSIDITIKAKERYRFPDGSIVIPAESHFAGKDPAGGKVKSLTVKYRIGNTPFTCKKNEHEIAVIVGPSFKRTESFSAKKAWYGVPNKWADVTGKLKKHLESGKCIKINRSLMGADPAKGKSKELVIIYSVNNKFKALIKREGALISMKNFPLAAPPQLMGIELSGESYNLIRTVQGNQKFRFTIFSQEEIPDATIHTKLRGLFHPYSKTKSWTYQYKAVNEQEFHVEYNTKRFGMYEFSVEIKDKEKRLLAQKTTMMAIIPEVTDHPKELGVCTHFGFDRWKNPELTLDLVRKAGFSNIRDELLWGRVEKDKGKFVFPKRYNKYIDIALSKGLEPLIIFDYGNGLYPKGSGKRGFPVSNEVRGKFVDYTTSLIKHFGSRVKNWELWNEPNGIKVKEEYLPLLKKVYKNVKRLDPQAKLISCGGGGAGGGPSGEYIGAIVHHGGLEYQDGFSIHPYMSPYDPETGYTATNSPIPAVNIPVVWKHLNNLCNRLKKRDGSKLEFWITEIGWPTYQGSNSEWMQAAYILRLYLLTRRYNYAKKIFWYDFKDDGIQKADREHNFGIIRQDFSPKPAYMAITVFSKIIGNKPFSKVWDDGKVKLYEYGHGNDSVVVLWSHFHGVKYHFKVSKNIKSVTVTDWQYGKRVIKEEKGEIKIKAQPMPQFITFNH